MGTSLQAALQEHANGLVFLLVVFSSTKTVILLLLPTPHNDSEPVVVSKRANDQVIIKIGRPICYYSVPYH